MAANQRTDTLERNLQEAANAKTEQETLEGDLRKRVQDLEAVCRQKDEQIQQLSSDNKKLEEIKDDMLAIRDGVMEAHERDNPDGRVTNPDTKAIDRKNLLVHGGNYVLDREVVLRLRKGDPRRVARFTKTYGFSPHEQLSGLILQIVNEYGTLSFCYYELHALPIQYQAITTTLSEAREVQKLDGTTATVRLRELLKEITKLSEMIRKLYRNTL